MKSARGLLAALVVLGSASLGLAGCAAAADGGARAAAADQSPSSACAPSYSHRCARGGVGDGEDDWGGDHWWLVLLRSISVRILSVWLVSSLVS